MLLAGRANRSEMRKKNLILSNSRVYVVDTSAFIEWLPADTQGRLFAVSYDCFMNPLLGLSDLTHNCTCH